MSDSAQFSMSVAEREVIKVLWDHGPRVVRDVIALVREQGHEWTRSTVVTLLRRLEAKRYIESDKSQFAFVYKPLVSREEEMYSQMMKLARMLSNGKGYPLILAFVAQHRFSTDELVRLRTLIDEL